MTKILNKLLKDIPESSLHSTVVFKLNSGSNSNIYIVDSISKLQGDQSANANKFWSIDADITLDEAITIPTGVIFIDGGGTITNTVNADVTFIDSQFQFSSLRIVWDFSLGVLNNASTFTKGQSINLENFGAIGDGNLETSTGTDNRNVFMQMQKIYNKSGGTGYLNTDNAYMYSVITSATFYEDDAQNMHITGDGASFICKNNATIGVLVNNLEKYDIFSIFRSKNSVSHINVHGDLKNHDFGVSALSPYCHGIVITGHSENVKLSGTATNTSGSSVHGTYYVQFAYNNGLNEAAFTKDFTLNTSTGVAEASTVYSYSQDFALTTRMLELGEIAVGGSSFAGDAGLDIRKYKVAFYDATNTGGSDTTTGFLGIVGEVETFTPIKIPENAASVRVIIYSPDDWSGLSNTLYGVNHAKNVLIENFHASWGMYHGFSNLNRGITLGKNVTVSNTGQNYSGTAGSPGFGLNWEDGYENLSGATVDGLVVVNSTMGDFIIRSARNMNLTNFKFLAPTDSRFTGKIVSLDESYNFRMSNGLMENKQLSLGNTTLVDNVALIDTRVRFSQAEAILQNSTTNKNVSFDIYGVVRGKKDVMRDNYFHYPHPLDATYIFNDLYDVDVINNTFDFKGQDWNTSTKRLGSAFSGKTTANKAVYNGNKIINLVTPSGTAQSNGYKQNVYKKVKDNEYGVSLEIIGGTTQDIIWQGNTHYGWVDYELSDYPTTNAGTFNTIKWVDQTIHIKDYNLLAGGTSRMLRLPARDFDFYAENSTFFFDDATAPFGEEDRFFALNNYGTKTFKNCTIKSSIAATQDLSGSDVTGGTLMFINCTFEGYNISAMRSGDKILYTYPDANCPSYADNATALVALGEGYFYKDTTSGKFEVTIT